MTRATMHKWTVSILLICVVFFLSMSTISLAMGEGEVLPHEYTESQINVDLNYYREDQRGSRQALPEEQRVLSFVQSENRFFTDVEGQLFSPNRPTSNSVVVKSESMNLFEASRVSSERAMRESVDERAVLSIDITVILAAIVLMVIGVLIVFILPQLIQKPSKYDQL